MRFLKGVLLFLHLLVGIGAVFGGWAAISDPLKPLGAPLSLLVHSPFVNFFIPGLLLFAVIGLGNLFSAALFAGPKPLQIYSSLIISFGLIIWILVQVFMLRTVDILHVIFLLIGFVQAGISLLLLYQARLFPVSLLEQVWQRMRK